MEVEASSLTLNKFIIFDSYKMTETCLYDYFKQYGKIQHIVRDDNTFLIHILAPRPLFEAIGSHFILDERRINIHKPANNENKLAHLIYLNKDKQKIKDKQKMMHVDCNPVPIPESLLVPENEDSPKHIINILYDDVLKKIFEQPTLGIFDLYHLANVNKCFRSIAIDGFQRKTNGVINMYNVFPAQTPLWLVEDFLQIFGDVITEVECDGYIMSQCAFHFALRYCPNITRIQCNDIREPLLPQHPCPKLTKLCLSGFILNDVLSTSAFFKANSQLIDVEFVDLVCNFEFAYILEQLLNVRRLCVSPREYKFFAWYDFKSFKEMKQLKELDLKYIRGNDLMDILEVLHSGNVELECLKAGNVIDMPMSAAFIERICKLKSIKTLHLVFAVLSDESILSIGKELIHLTDLRIERCQVSLNGIRCAMNEMKNLKSIEVRSSFISLIENDLMAIDDMRTSRSIDVRILVDRWDHNRTSIVMYDWLRRAEKKNATFEVPYEVKMLMPSSARRVGHPYDYT